MSELPKGFLELLQAYEDGKIYRETNRKFGICTVNFTDGHSVEISDVEFMIHEHLYSEPSEVTKIGNYWVVGERNTGISFDPSLSDRQAYPIYAYYDCITLYIYLSNGNVLEFLSTAVDKLKYQNIPVVKIDTDGQPILDKKNYVEGTIHISDPEGLYGVISNYTADMRIRGRGNSTWGFPKKPWKVKLDKAAPILGMPSDKEWALLANYTDRTLIRNVVAMKLSEICGFSWTPRMFHVDVYLNDEYQGVYTFCEHKKISSDRIDIDLIGPEDNEGEALTGDYYLEIEAAMDKPICWRTDMGVPILFSDPEDPTQQQISYIRNLLDEFEATLYSDHIADPEKGYAAYIDVDSFINYYIVQELTKNIDGNLFKSAFLTKQRGGKLEMYHLWDFDLTMGNCGYFHGQTGSGPENFWIKDFNSYSKPGDNWFNRMMTDPQFMIMLKKRWNELMPEFRKIPEFIDEQAFILSKAQKRNFEVWGINESIDWVMFPSLGSYDAEVEYLKEFYTTRLEWLNTHINLM